MSTAAATPILHQLARTYVERFPVQSASELESATDEHVDDFLADVSPRIAASVLSSLTPVTAERLLRRTEPAAAATWLDSLEPSRAAALLARLDAGARAELLRRLRPRLAAELEELTQYPRETAGALMDPRIMAFAPDMTVGDALQKLQKVPQKKAVELFLVDADGHLSGAVPLQALIIGAPDQPLHELTGPAPVAVQAMASRDEVIEALSDSKMAGVVVVDADERVVGVIRRDALIRAAREEASADAQTMVGASKDERALSPTLFAVRKRLPWLVVNLGTAFLAAAVVNLFESTIAKFTALAVLLPVVAGQSGNTGAQALAVTMRGLALREVRTRHAARVALKESRVAVLNGLGIAAITASAVYWWSGSTGLTLVIGLSMVLSMAAAGLAGASIPMLLTALRQDPAQSSSIVLTTVTDVVGFLSFLGIATLMASLL